MARATITQRDSGYSSTLALELRVATAEQAYEPSP